MPKPRKQGAAPAKVYPPLELKSTHPLTGKTVSATVRADANVGRRKEQKVKGVLQHSDSVITCIAGRWWWTSNVAFA